MIDSGVPTLTEAREAQRVNAKSQVHAWVKFDLKMEAWDLTPEQVEKLLTRLGF